MRSSWRDARSVPCVGRMGTSLGNFIDKEGEGHLGRVVAMWDAFPASRVECLMPPMGHLRTEYSGRSVTTGKDEEDTQRINGLPHPVTGLLIVNATKALSPPRLTRHYDSGWMKEKLSP